MELERLSIMISPELLKRYPLFGSLSDEQLQSLASIAEEQSWEVGETIFEIGSPAENLYLLMEGSIDLFYRVEDEQNPDETKHFGVGEINPGEPFAISALFEPYELTASAVASRPSKGIQMDAQRLLQLGSYDLELGMILQRELIKAIFERLTYARNQLVAARA
jgi:CRP-like cAMP-binding protein